MADADATQGSFVWYDLLTRDVQAAAAFYAHVIGWTAQPFDGSGGYTMFVGSAGPLGGVGELPEISRKRGVPPHWTSNVYVDDVDKTAAEARRLGGRVLVEPSDFPNVGRLAVLADPEGVPINIFKPRGPMKLHDQTTPGEINWCELVAANHETAFAYYSRLFGWKKAHDFDMGPMGKYVIYGVGDRDLGGMFTKPKEVPASMWFYYIQVESLGAAMERAQAKGAKVLNGPMEVPGGAHIAQLVDPQGAAFALHESAKSA